MSPLAAMADIKQGGGTTTTKCSVCVTRTDKNGVETTNCIDVECSKITIEKDAAGHTTCADSAGHKGVVTKPGVCKLAPYAESKAPTGATTRAQ